MSLREESNDSCNDLQSLHDLHSDPYAQLFIHRGLSNVFLFLKNALASGTFGSLFPLSGISTHCAPSELQIFLSHFSGLCSGIKASGIFFMTTLLKITSLFSPYILTSAYLVLFFVHSTYHTLICFIGTYLVSFGFLSPKITT